MPGWCSAASPITTTRIPSFCSRSATWANEAGDHCLVSHRAPAFTATSAVPGKIPAEFSNWLSLSSAAGSAASGNSSAPVCGAAPRARGISR